MGSTLLSLLPFIIGSAVVPVQVTLGILLLTSSDIGLQKASAYVGGMTIVRLFQGLLFGFVLTGEGSVTARTPIGTRGPVVATFLLVLGLLLLISVYRLWNKEEDLDAPPPRWMSLVDRLTVWKAFGIGFGMMLFSLKFWIFTLSALATIGEAQLGQPFSTFAYLFFVFMAEFFLLVPILIRIFVPQHSKNLLSDFSEWLTKNNQTIAMTISFVFGLLFLYLGIDGLLI